MKPTMRITDPRFKYVPAAQSDIRKTFQRVRRELKAAQEERASVVLALPNPKLPRAAASAQSTKGKA